MKIGILSDSHCKTKRLARAIELLVDRGAEAIVHCGDIGHADDMAVLGAAPVPTYAVAGNMDHKVSRLEAAAEAAGVQVCSEVVEVPIGADQFLVATHGNDEAVLAELIGAEQFPYVCHGHTHRARDERIGPVRVINPGALRHYKVPHRPVAVLLDTHSDTLEVIDVPK